MSKGAEITPRDLDERLRRVEILIATQTAVTFTLILPLGSFLAYALWQHLLFN
jgi:hypothetical protein